MQICNIFDFDKILAYDERSKKGDTMAHFWYNLRNRFIRAYNSGYLPKQDGHKIFFQEIGNPKGQPVICFHGGPGCSAGISGQATRL